MVVAGGEWQVPLIQRAREYGAFVVNTNLYSDSVGFRYADAGFVADVRDFDANLMIARRYPPDAIITDQSDVAVPTVARLCEELGIAGIGIAVAKRFTNKPEMRKICRDIGHPTPEFAVCQTEKELCRFRDDIQAPIVVKPTDSQSSRGVCRIGIGESISKAFANAIQYSSDNCVLAERFIPGPEFTVEGIAVNHQHQTLATSVKHHFGHNPMVADQLLYGSSETAFNLGKLHLQHDRLVEAMGLPFGLTHAEYKLCNGEFYLIEVAARGGGTRVSSHIVPFISGVDTNRLLIEMALGLHVEPVICQSENRAAVLRFFEFPSGTVSRISGIDRAMETAGVMDILLNFKVGSHLAPSVDDRSRHMHIIATGTDAETVQDIAQRAYEQIVISYE
jgi:biotin carboxylase